MDQQHALWTGAPPAHVHPPETTVEPDPTQLLYDEVARSWEFKDTFRHSGWQPDRRRVLEAMWHVPVPTSRMASFAECGNSHWVLRNKADPDLFRIVPDHCHDRFCVPCGLGRQALIRANLADRLRDGAHRLITLTIRHEDESLTDLIDHLYDSFRRLRNRLCWKAHVAGGVAFLEITQNQDTGSWHPHLHCVTEGRYFDLQDLRRLWLGVTGDSTGADISIIRNRQRVIDYVSKYATKPLPSYILHDEPSLVEALRALHGRRMLLPFGAWKSWKLLDDPTEAGWELFDHLTAIQHNAWDGDSLCENIIAMISTADPETGEFVVLDGGPPPDG